MRDQAALVRWIRLGCALAVHLLIADPVASDEPLTVDNGKPAGGAVTAKLLRYAQRVVARYDSNADGRLDSKEWTSMSGRPDAADLDGDGGISADEFARYAADYGSGRRIRLSTAREPVAQAPQPRQPSADNQAGATGGDTAEQPAVVLEQRRDLKYFVPLPGGAPSWFVERDADGDAQLSLAEYSPKLRSTEVAEFKGYDLNGDGLLTLGELTRSTAASPTEKPATAPPPPK